MAGIFDFLGGLGAGGGGGGPTQLTPYFGGQAGGYRAMPAMAAYQNTPSAAPAASPGGGFMEALNNPWIAAAMGAGNAMMGAADAGGGIGEGLRAGLGGGLGSYVGASQLESQRQQEESERKELERLLEDFRSIARRSAPRGAMSMPPAVGVLESYGGLI